MRSFARFRTAHKLLLGISVCLILTLLTSALLILQMEQLCAVSAELAHDPLPGTAYIARTTSDIKQFRLDEYSWLLGGGPPNLRMTSGAQAVREDLIAYEGTITKPEDRANFDRLSALWGRYLQLHNRMEASAAMRRHDEAIPLIQGEMADVSRSMETLLGTMIQWNKRNGERLAATADAKLKAARWMQFGGILSMVILGALSLIFNRAVELPISHLAETVRAVAGGQAEARAVVSGPAEVAVVANEFNHMLDTLKRAESEIRTLNAELEARVQERTSQLTQANVELASEIKERTQFEERLRGKNEELKGFAYTVSHDLKAPLRGITGYAQELDRKHKEGLSERACFCIHRILSASSNLDQLIEDLLLYSRLETQSPTLSPISLPRLVDEILKDRMEVISERRIEIATEIEIKEVYEWERGLSQVLTNLLDNAIKYTRDTANPRIVLSARGDADTYQLSVSDNGIGFDMKYADQIWGLFHRLVRQEDFDGTGAGLAIVKKLVDKRGGRIWADAHVGVGATFFVEMNKEPYEGAHP